MGSHPLRHPRALIRRKRRSLNLDEVGAVGDRVVIEWRQHRFEVVQVVEVGGSSRQCLLRFADQPGRLPVSVPEEDLSDSIPITG